MYCCCCVDVIVVVVVVVAVCINWNGFCAVPSTIWRVCAVTFNVYGAKCHRQHKLCVCARARPLGTNFAEH